jgi:hypothetical protein
MLLSWSDRPVSAQGGGRQNDGEFQYFTVIGNAPLPSTGNISADLTGLVALASTLLTLASVVHTRQAARENGDSSDEYIDAEVVADDADLDDESHAPAA